MIPFSCYIDFNNGEISNFNNIVVRPYSEMAVFFNKSISNDNKIKLEDKLIYKSYEVRIPKENGNLSWCTTIVYPGNIDGEYYMTKGHFHKQDYSAELYLCIQGNGYIIMQNNDGAFMDYKISPGVAINIPPKWAHRVINSDDKNKLIFIAIYASDAGHDYSFIEKKGFSKLLIKKDGMPKFVDNPKYK
jgi:glucose-6-phosphate isomerase, archaeal